MRKPRYMNARIFLLLIAMLGLYTNSSLIVPYDLFIVPGIAGIFISSLRRSLVSSIVTLSIVMFAVFLISVVFQSRGTEQAEQFRSLVLFFLTIAAAGGALSMVLDLPRETAFRFARFVILAMLAGLVLERLGVTRPASDAFREWFYPDSIVYSNDFRDIQNYGFVRPKLFSSEPSHAAKFFGTMVAVAIALRPASMRVIYIFVWVIMFLILLPSAGILFGVGAGFLFVAFGRSDSTRSPFLIRSGMIVALMFIGIYFGYEIVSRLGIFSGGLEASAFERLKQPFLLAVSALEQRPLFGYGIGAESSMISVLQTVRENTDTPWFFLQQAETEAVRGSFLFAMLWQFGVVGTAALWLGIVNLIRKIAPGNLFFGIVFFALLGLSVGDIHTPMSWGYFVVFLGALGHSSSSNRVSATATQIAPNQLRHNARVNGST